MVSTYLSYNLVMRDLKSSLDRVESDSVVARESAYYEENIGKVTSLEEFLDDYRLYNYAMKAHGLEEMAYAKAFMKKVLESDLSDENSFANQLSDERYRDFAQAYQFNGQTKDAQTEFQETEMLSLYEEAIAAESDTIETETNYYEKTINTVTTAQQLVRNSRLFNYMVEAYGIDPTYYSKDHFVKVLTSDVSDPDSYVNQLVASGAASAAAFRQMALGYNFEADGTLASGVKPQTDSQMTFTVNEYIDSAQTYVSEFYLEREREYYASKIGSITSVSELTSDSRLFNYVKTAFQLDSTVTSTVFKNIVTSDLSDPANYANVNGGDAWVKVAQAFNFATDGTVKSGLSAQLNSQIVTTNSGFTEYYDDADVEKKEYLLGYYTDKMADITEVDDIFANESLRIVLLRAFGLEPDEYTNAELKKVLTSDITDPKSYANKTKDDRLIQMATLFNFDSEGQAAEPLLAQNQGTITTVAANYIINKIMFLEGDERDAAREKADAESSYYSENILGIRTAEDFLADRRLVDVVLISNGFDPDEVTDDFLKQVFASDLTDDKSFVNQQSDGAWAELLASFNFDVEGNLTRDTVGTIQQRGAALETINQYVRQTLEENEGASNEAVRLALYFERKIEGITDAYEIIADDALAEVFRVTFGYTEDFANLDVDVQAKIIDKNLDLSEMRDPAKVERFLQRFTAMWDMENGATDPVLNIFSNGYQGISADLLMSIASLRSG
ncbi:DUF1217 domain-containing protein [Ciceribacter sp. L1K23]|uniref:DUF1217 domain-containing protein n=1 Tax=Ciceribacter sp. L1K23 TaxID=2820276 RepID=UPI001B8352F4|nr:DUF1217 domain-containing protein [Ciceribacter sp. L1K23]MBR0556753.1 DUF1217 domain-containing protein [Ciceribacter sp. L1K23]